MPVKNLVAHNICGYDILVQTRDDMVVPPRQDQAKTAGYIIYNSFSQSSVSNQRPPGEDPSAMMNSNHSGLNAYVEGSENGKMSAVRRHFCLVATFDLILTFIMWVIYTEDLGLDHGWAGFLVQVEHYIFKYSLFDIVMMSAARFAGLILAYALFRIRHWWMVAVTTFATCVLLLVKCFLFMFNDSITPDPTETPIIIRGKTGNGFCYVLLIFSFIIVWGEVWFLDFKVLTQEEKARRRAASYSERAPLLGHGGPQAPHLDTNRYYTPEGSDEERERSESEAEYRSLPGTRGHSRNASRSSINSAGALREQEYLRMGKETLSIVLEMYRTEDGWKHETGISLQDGIVSSRQVKNIGKVFRLEAIVNIGTSELYQDVVYGVNDLPQWNPTVLESKTLQVVDGTTEVAYSIAAEAVGGMISSRDFITLRHWGCTGDIYYSTGCNATHPDMPPTKKHVRGENGHGGWLFKDIPNQPDQCLFIWYINTNLKGWLPQTLIDQGLSSYLIEYLGYMRKHIEDINDAKDTDPA